MFEERVETSGGQDGLFEAPAPFQLSMLRDGDTVAVCYSGRVLARYESGDRGLRSLAIVALTDAGFRCVDVARVFGISAEHVSRLRKHARDGGSSGLVPQMGRPRKLDERAVKRAYELSEKGVTGVQIARRLKVCEATVSRLLARRPAPAPVPVQETIELDGVEGSDVTAPGSVQVSSPAQHSPQQDSPAGNVTVGGPPTAGTPAGDGSGGGTPAAGTPAGDGSGVRIVEGGGRCRYAGAMLLHPFLEKVGADGVFGALASGPVRRYDSGSLALCAMFAITLGSSSLEGSKHLDPREAGMLVGVGRLPHLRTLRPRAGPVG